MAQEANFIKNPDDIERIRSNTREKFEPARQPSEMPDMFAIAHDQLNRSLNLYLRMFNSITDNWSAMLGNAITPQERPREE